MLSYVTNFSVLLLRPSSLYAKHEKVTKLRQHFSPTIPRKAKWLISKWARWVVLSRQQVLLWLNLILEICNSKLVKWRNNFHDEFMKNSHRDWVKNYLKFAYYSTETFIPPKILQTFRCATLKLEINCKATSCGNGDPKREAPTPSAPLVANCKEMPSKLN